VKSISKSTLRSKIILFFILILELVLIPISALIGLRGSINYDEAYFLQAPSSLVKEGTYSTTYDGGLNFDPGISTGPTVLLPIGLSFKLFGIGIVQARFVMLVYFLLMITMTFQVCKTLFGGTSAVFSLLLILCLPDTFFLALRVFGEIPSIFFFMAGCWMLIKKKAFLSGLFIGLAILTKLLFAISIPAVLLLFFIDFVNCKEHRKQIAITYAKGLFGTLLPILAWEGIKFLSLGQSGYLENLAKFSKMLAISSSSQDIFTLPVMLSRIEVFASPFQLIPPSVVFAIVALAIVFNLLLLAKSEVIKMGQGDWLSRARLMLSIFSFIYLVWWIFGKHIEWYRYLFLGYVIMMVVIGSVFTALIERIDRFALSSQRINRVTRTIYYAAGVIAILVFSGSFFVEPAYAQSVRIKSFLQDVGLSTQLRVAGEISRIEKIGGSIAYWNWWHSPEIRFLSQSRFKDLFKVETRQELDEQVINGKKVYVLVSPTQTQMSPETWEEERIYCGELIYGMSGYQLFEYTPAYSSAYRDFIEHEYTASLPNVYTLIGQDSLIDYHAKGFTSAGWIGRKASLWLNNERGSDTLVIEGNTNLDFIKKGQNSVKIYVMAILLGEEKITQSRNFVWEFKLPAWAKSFKALRIDFEASKVFTPEALGSGKDNREISILITRIELR
jgi:4-amino-4-deoxy-L-arabinose transferase-like glycosyltransferase